MWQGKIGLFGLFLTKEVVSEVNFVPITCLTFERAPLACGLRVEKQIFQFYSAAHWYSLSMNQKNTPKCTFGLRKEFLELKCPFNQLNISCCRKWQLLFTENKCVAVAKETLLKACHSHLTGLVENFQI